MRRWPPVKAMSAAATMTETTSSWAKLSQPSANAAGTLSIAANRVRSMATITGRLRRNSTHGPSGTATSAPAASPAAASADTSAAPACSTSMAISGNAPNASHVPSALTAYAPHSQPNCRPSDRPFLMPGTLRPSRQHRTAWTTSRWPAPSKRPRPPRSG